MKWIAVIHKTTVMAAGFFLLTGGATALGDDLLSSLDALDASIARARTLNERSSATLDELRRDLFDGAVKAREAKRISDAIDKGRVEGQPIEDEMALLRDDITQIGAVLRGYRDRIDAMNEIIQTGRRALDKQEQELAALRRAKTGAKSDAEIKALRAQLDKANQTVAEYAKTIARLTAESGVAPVAVIPAATSPKAPTFEIGGKPLVQGYDALAAGRVDEAAAAFRAALAQNPMSDSARLGLAACHFEWNELETTRLMVQEMLERDETNARALGLLGAVELREGNTRTARKHLERAVKLDDQDPYIHNYLGVVYQQSKKHKAAIEQVRKAVELDPEYVGALYNLSVLLATARAPDIESARFYYNHMLALGGPPSPALEALLGQ